MGTESIFRFVHIRPPFRSEDQSEKKEKKTLDNNTTSVVLENTEKKAKEEGISFEKSRTISAKEFIYSKDFIIKNDFFNNEESIEVVKKLIDKKHGNKDFKLLQGITKILPIKSNSPNVIQSTIRSFSQKMWDSYYSLRIIPNKEVRQLLPKAIFWIKVFQLYEYKSDQEQLLNYIEDFDTYNPALDVSFYTKANKTPASNPTKNIKIDPLLDRKNKIKDVSAQIEKLSQIKNKLNGIIKQKENKLIVPIAPKLTDNTDQKIIKKYNKELAAYQNRLLKARSFEVKDFSKNEKLILDQNKISVFHQSQPELDETINTKITSLTGELNTLSLIETIQIKNGRFVKTLKKIQP